jgi:hypothetical protein
VTAHCYYRAGPGVTRIPLVTWIGLNVVGTAVIGTLVKAVIGLRIAPEVERQGLDINEHGEKGTSHREQSLLHKGRKGHNEKNYFQ